MLKKIGQNQCGKIWRHTGRADLAEDAKMATKIHSDIIVQATRHTLIKPVA